MSRSELGEEEEDDGCECELNEHMHARGKKWEMKVEMARIKHPLVILEFVRRQFKTWGCTRHTMDIDNEKRYQRPIRRPLMRLFLTTF